MSSIESLKSVYFLTQVNKLGNVKIKSILNHFELPEDLFKCGENEFRRIPGIDSNITEEIFSTKKEKDRIFRVFDQIIGKSEKSSVKIISILDIEFPENLKRIYDSPVLLYYKGKLTDKDKYSLSIVGTRNPTEYGKYNCEKFTEQISNLNIPVISGFARGIDTIVHKTCLKNNNMTYAVFGCGIDVVYPYENSKLYKELIEKGALISEFPLGAKPDKMNFPRRNRIISGISLGTLVIESGIKGGALLTAEIAVDQDKEVFAVPGYINSKQSEGTNELIKRGQAKLVTNIEDIIEELEIKLRPVLNNEHKEITEISLSDLNESELKIYSILDYEPIHIDEINEKTNLTISDCLVNLLTLEFKSLVKQIPGKYFLKN